ncbi:enoyl-CoA hydratase/isomerase family protein [Novosphingobium lentum]|uniref:enoyl-CoA hydratase/isomerase family protein n=1 Tax=Novosphingobium lentum TaxID=145287 RepID=UPI0008322A38|nr:enoyl-CoA hydratase-related protein [Novosphingobium lentum]
MAAIELDMAGPIARLTLNRPEVGNALDSAACELMLHHAREVERSPHVRCLILAGQGRHFSTGGDLSSLAPLLADPATNMRGVFESNVVRMANEFCQVIERLPVPVIASVRGAVTGGGFGFACAADFIVASDTAFFLAAHILAGLTPDGGISWYLTRLLGPKLAKDILMLPERIDAAEALRIGLVREVVPDAELEAATQLLAERLVAMPRIALAGIKALVNAAPQHSFADHLQMEARLMGLAAEHPDFREGVAAFAEKRKPRFGQGDG